MQMCESNIVSNFGCDVLFDKPSVVVQCHVRRADGKVKDHLIKAGCVLMILMCFTGHMSWAQTNTSNVRQAYKSHQPLFTNVPPSLDPLPDQQVHFVSPQGNDRADGTHDQPWQTVQHGVKQLGPGDTLVLRQGIYYEEVTVSVLGTADRPITIRSYPGELATLSGAMRMFEQNPATAWEPVANPSPNQDDKINLYRATRRLPNLRDVMGRFGDSNQGLVTHLHQSDLLATNEHYLLPEGADRKTTDYEPVYLGPGLFYNAQNGELLVRLDHTRLPDPIVNYRGQTDPRKMPLVISSFNALPLEISGSTHLAIKDLTITAGGYDTVIVKQTDNLIFDRVNILAGTYGLRAEGLTNFEMRDSMLLGNCPPWHFRSDNSLRARPGKPFRDLARYNTHALLVTQGAQEFSVFALPINDHWHLHHNIFAQAHDGLYLGGITTDFHHNLITELQDDGLYLSPMYRRIGHDRAQLNIYQNLFGACATALAMGGPRPETDIVYLYRNIFDLRGTIPFSRPRTDKPVVPYTGKPIGDHGGPPWPDMFVYHNTFIQTQRSRLALMAFDAAVRETTRRYVFNNLFYHHNNLPRFVARGDKGDLRVDGNLYWTPDMTSSNASSYFNRFRASDAFTASQQQVQGGSTSHSIVADPNWASDPNSDPWPMDVRSVQGSPMIDAGIAIDQEWPDPLRGEDEGQPDIGALPYKSAVFQVGPRPLK